MKHTAIIARTLFFCLIAACICQTALQAKEDIPEPTENRLFSNQKRPVPDFDHTLHEDSLGDTGCALCHHVMDTNENKLVYSEGEESACSECHSPESSEAVLTLRDASHASCTGCHRKLKKEKKSAGPTTCGECHRKQD